MAKVIRHSSGNVFRDLGIEDDEAENLRIRAKLMIALTEHLKNRRITQARAAKVLGVSQPRISNLMRGKIQHFSVDSLIEMLGRAGLRVEVTTRKARRGAWMSAAYEPEAPAPGPLRSRRAEAQRPRSLALGARQTRPRLPALATRRFTPPRASAAPRRAAGSR